MTASLQVSATGYPVLALGPGRRLGIWLQGCPLACPGCMSRDTWDPAGGEPVPVAELARAWRDAVSDGADGLTISGGEPLAQPGGLAALVAAVDAVRVEEADRELDLLVFTGYEEDELDADQQSALASADAVIFGRYEAARPSTLIWRGSANQRLAPRTPLGRRRYGPWVDHSPERPPLQLAAEPAGLRFVGVPPHGGLGRLEEVVRAHGVNLAGTTWWPEGATGQDGRINQRTP